MKNYLLFLSILLLHLFAKSQVTGTLQTSVSQLSFTVENSFDRVEIIYPSSVKTFNSNHSQFGEPEIPVIQKKYVVPLDADQISIQLLNTTVQALSGTYLRGGFL